jgi:hypothetical protein
MLLFMLRLFVPFAVLLCWLAWYSANAYQNEKESAQVQALRKNAERFESQYQYDSAFWYYTEMQQVLKREGKNNAYLKAYLNLYNNIALREDWDWQEKYDFLAKEDNGQDFPHRHIGVQHGKIILFSEKMMEDSLSASYEEVEKLCSTLGDFGVEALVEIQMDIAIGYMQAGYSQKAKQWIERGKSLVENPKNEKLINDNWFNVAAVVYNEALERRKALEYGLAFLARLESKPVLDSFLLSDALNNLGTVYSSMGDYANALKYYERSISLGFTGLLPIDLARTQGNIASCLPSDNEQYRYYLRLAIENAKLADNDASLGLAYLRLSQAFDENNPKHRDSINWYIRNGWRLIGKTEKLVSHIYMYVNQDTKNEAKKILAQFDPNANAEESSLLTNYYVAMLKVAALDGDLPAVKRLLPLMAKIQSKQENFTGADWTVVPQASELLSPMKIRLALEYLLAEKQLTDKLTDLEHLSLLSQQVKIAKHIFKELNNQKEREEILSKFVVANVQKAASICQRLYQQTQDKKYLVQAFDLSEQARGATLSEQRQKENAISAGGVPDSIVQAERQLIIELEEIRRAAIESRLAKRFDDVKEFEKSVFEKEHELSKLKTFLEQKYPKYYKARYAQREVSLPEIQSRLTQDDVMLEYLYLGEASNHDYLLFAIYPQDVAFYRVTSGPTELQGVDSFFHALTHPEAVINDAQNIYNTVTHYGHQYFLRFVQPAIRPGLKRLIVLPDGPLHRFPFDAFLTQPARVAQSAAQVSYHNLKYLLHEYSTIYNFSAQLWLEQEEAPFSLPNTNILGYSADYDYHKNKNYQVKREPRIVKLRKTLVNLPGAEKEVSTLEKIYYGKFSRNEVANEQHFKKHSPSYGIIHLAMHGLMDPSNPTLSSLAFTETGDSLEDNFLHAYEVQNMDLRAGLVVLSACETGAGKYQMGDGIASMGRSFALAGVPSVILSLWSLNDHSGSLLIQLLYDKLCEDLPTEEALRSAKRQYLSQVEDLGQHPQYWSCLVLQGNTTVIPLRKAGSGHLYWLFGSLAVSLLGGGLWYWRQRSA